MWICYDSSQICESVIFSYNWWYFQLEFCILMCLMNKNCSFNSFLLILLPFLFLPRKWIQANFVTFKIITKNWIMRLSTLGNSIVYRYPVFNVLHLSRNLLRLANWLLVFFIVLLSSSPSKTSTNNLWSSTV